MNKFTLFTLAATALVPVGAAAQTSHSTSHSSSHSASHSNARSHSGVSWQQRRQGMQRHHGNRQVIIHRRGGEHVRRGGHHMGGGQHVIRRHHGINKHRNYRRFDRGFILPHSWWGPRFHVQNWGMYGFPAPMHGNRWIRYYDDALLIDQHGRIVDGRWGMNWDRYQDRWAYDEEGTPYYDGDEDEEYGWEERDGDYAEHDGPPPPPHHVPPVPPMPCPQACAHPGYGYAHPGYGYGYGWMHGGMVTITETTVHAAAPQVVTETVYIEKKVKTKPRRTYKRAKPRPQPGERG